MVKISAKAFTYDKRYDSFTAEAEQVGLLSTRDQTAAKKEMGHQRKRGLFGRFHNIVKHIRASVLRKQRIDACVRVIAAEIEAVVVMEEM